MKMVQVTSDAKARPIMTALTTTSADLNIVHGDNSLSSAVAAFSTLASRSAGGAGASHGGGGGGRGVGWGTALGGCDPAGAVWAMGADGAAGVAFCWAEDDAASDSIASAETTINVVTRERDMFIILRPSSGSGCER